MIDSDHASVVECGDSILQDVSGDNVEVAVQLYRRVRDDIKYCTSSESCGPKVT